MKLSRRTIEVLVKFILGESQGREYRKGKEIIKFFNNCLGEEEIYGKDFGTRAEYVESKLKRLNGSDSLVKVVEETFDPSYLPRHLENTNKLYDAEQLLVDDLSYFNQFLTKDGYVCEILANKHRKYIKISALTPGLVDFPNKTITSEFIKEQIDKCNSKIMENDLDGAITNARSLLEAVLEYILNSLGHEIPKYDGDLLLLYKSVRKYLNLDPKKDIDDCFKQITSGIITSITGVAGISNKMSDRHSRKCKPLQHHTCFAVDSAFTICKFLLGVLEYRRDTFL